MLSVEDWAEIRRLHRAEGMPIKAIARVMGISRNTVRAALAADGPPKYRAGAGGVARGRGRAADPGAAQGVPDDAGDGDRGADRLAALGPDAARAGSRSCGRSICRRIRPGRTAYEAGEIAQCDFWFPEIEVPVGFGQTRTREAAAGADDGLRLLAVAVGGAGPVADRGGPVRRAGGAT